MPLPEVFWPLLTAVYRASSRRMGAGFQPARRYGTLVPARAALADLTIIGSSK